MNYEQYITLLDRIINFNGRITSIPKEPNV